MAPFDAEAGDRRVRGRLALAIGALVCLAVAFALGLPSIRGRMAKRDLAEELPGLAAALDQARRCTVELAGGDIAGGEWRPLTFALMRDSTFAREADEECNAPYERVVSRFRENIAALPDEDLAVALRRALETYEPFPHDGTAEELCAYFDGQRERLGELARALGQELDLGAARECSREEERMPEVVPLVTPPDVDDCREPYVRIEGPAIVVACFTPTASTWSVSEDGEHWQHTLLPQEAWGLGPWNVSGELMTWSETAKRFGTLRDGRWEPRAALPRGQHPEQVAVTAQGVVWVAVVDDAGSWQWSGDDSWVVYRSMDGMRTIAAFGRSPPKGWGGAAMLHAEEDALTMLAWSPLEAIHFAEAKVTVATLTGSEGGRAKGCAAGSRQWALTDDGILFASVDSGASWRRLAAVAASDSNRSLLNCRDGTVAVSWEDAGRLSVATCDDDDCGAATVLAANVAAWASEDTDHGLRFFVELHDGPGVESAVVALEPMTGAPRIVDVFTRELLDRSPTRVVEHDGTRYLLRRQHSLVWQP